MTGWVIVVGLVVAITVAALAIPVLLGMRKRGPLLIILPIVAAVAIGAGIAAYNLGFVITYSAAALAVALTLAAVAVVQKRPM